MPDRNGWTLWSESPPPKSEDHLLVVRTNTGLSYEYRCAAWDEACGDFLSLDYPIQPFYPTGHAQWKAVAYPAIVEDYALSLAS